VQEAEGSLLLEAVARDQLLKTQQAKKRFTDAVVICELWRLAVVLQLLVVPSDVYTWSKNPISNPYTVYSHTPLNHKNILIFTFSNSRQVDKRF
jgi:hypothetical protein